MSATPFRLAFIPALLLTQAGLLSAQETSFGYRVLINSTHKLSVRTDSSCAPIVNGVRNDGCSPYGRAVYYERLPPDLRIGGAASIHRDPNDPSLLHVNYFTMVCPSGSTFALLEESADPPTRESVACASTEQRLNASRFAVQLSNRESVTFSSRSWHLRAITIPLKVRRGYDHDEIRVNSRAEANINGNFFAGYRFGREKYSYERGASRDPYTQFHYTPGLFIGASAVTVGPETSKTADTPLTESVSMAVVSVGGGALLGFRNFSIGAFVGTDLGLFDGADEWDYHGRPFLGIGITVDSFLQALRL